MQRSSLLVKKMSHECQLFQRQYVLSVRIHFDEPNITFSVEPVGTYFELSVIAAPSSTRDVPVIPNCQLHLYFNFRLAPSLLDFHNTKPPLLSGDERDLGIAERQRHLTTATTGIGMPAAKKFLSQIRPYY